MNTEIEKDLKTEIEHIFESGANEIRIFEMVKTFIERRYLPLPLPSKEVVEPTDENIEGKWYKIYRQAWREEDFLKFYMKIKEEFNLYPPTPSKISIGEIEKKAGIYLSDKVKPRLDDSFDLDFLLPEISMHLVDFAKSILASDAVEFAEWLGHSGWILTDFENNLYQLIGDDGEFKPFTSAKTTSELYSLFSSNKEGCKCQNFENYTRLLCPLCTK